jgi:hypothetical protein
MGTVAYLEIWKRGGGRPEYLAAFFLGRRHADQPPEFPSQKILTTFFSNFSHFSHFTP